MSIVYLLRNPIFASKELKKVMAAPSKKEDGIKSVNYKLIIKIKMKKMLMMMVAAATLCSSSASAQKVNLPTQGTWGTELQFNPFDQNGKQFNLDALKVRYFLTDKDALRFSVGLGFNKENKWDYTNYEEPDADATQHDKDLYNYRKDNDENTTKAGHFTFDIGYERHFLKSGRIDLYAGAEIGVGVWWEKTNIIAGNSEGRDDVAFDPEKSSTYNLYTIETERTGGDNSYFLFHAAAFTGIDFYVYKGLYLGVELGLNINNKSYKDVEDTRTNNSSFIADKDRTETSKYANNKSGFDLGFDVTPTLRLGWAF